MERRKVGYGQTDLITGRIVMGILVIHLILILFFTFSPRKFLDKTHLRIFYSSLVLLGPFFSEDRILVSPHLFVRYKRGETWSPYFDNGSLSSQRPGSYHDRVIRDFIRGRTKTIYKANTGSKEQLQSLRQLEQFLTTHVFEEEKIDSLQLIYIQYRYITTSDQQVKDTIFQFTYAPQLVRNIE